jgi:hypothetical protein
MKMICKEQVKGIGQEHNVGQATLVAKFFGVVD